MMLLCIVLLLLHLPLVTLDVYGINPRFSNNRMDSTRRDRRNANRLFDSQNNARAGYNVGGANDRKLILTGIYEKVKNQKVPGIREKTEEAEGPPGKMKYYAGSQLDVQWTNQHECGGANTKCQLVLQYMCSNKLRDGILEDTIPYKLDKCDIGEDGVNRSCDEDRRFGMHEDRRYYTTCSITKRNKGLYFADENLARDETAIYTRQNDNGARRGYECPEERDYYPYWRPTPWIDLAVWTDDVNRCDMYQKESENVKSRFYCKVPEALMEKKLKGKWRRRRPKYNELIPITEEDCKKFTFNGEPAEWVEDNKTKHPAPECHKAPINRDNHHGNSGNGFFNTFSWTIPNITHNHCTLRLRYNISTSETPWEKRYERADPAELKKALGSNLRCTTEGNGCCTKNTPCVAGEGDCDRDSHCAEGYFCGTNNSPFDTSTDACARDVYQILSPAAKLIKAEASSVWRNSWRYQPKYAFSGRSRWRFFMSNREVNPWVRFTLEPIKLKSITIINRMRRYGELLRNVEIYAGNTPERSPNTLVGTFKGPGASGHQHLVMFSRTVLATSLTIRMNNPGNPEWMQINGIKVNQEVPESYKCRFHPGSGTGGKYKKISDETGNKCVQACLRKKKDDPSINGVAIRADGAGSCWCYTNMRNTKRAEKYKVCFLTAGREQMKDEPGFFNPRCRGEDGNCCTKTHPCEYGEGDCDSHDQCAGDLVCGRDNCFYEHDDDCCTVNDAARYIKADNTTDAKERGFIFENDPTVMPLKLFNGEEDIGKLLKLDLPINTAQYGRTFQDRSHEFSIMKRPAKLEGKTIHNIGVRGKRGNLQQVYPMTEYDFVPGRLEVEKGDHVHIQWTGSERNPRNNAGNGRRGYDRSNMVLLKQGDWVRSYPAQLNDTETLLGLGYQERQNLALSGNLPVRSDGDMLSSRVERNIVNEKAGKVLNLNCRGEGEIRVTSVHYGSCKDNVTCDACGGRNSMKRLKKACDGEKKCRIFAKKKTFGVHCKKEGFLNVTYKCINATEDPDVPKCEYTSGDVQSGGRIYVGRLGAKECVAECWKRKFVYKGIYGVAVMGDSLSPKCYCETGRSCRFNMDGFEDSEHSKFNHSKYRCNGQDNGCCTAKTPCELYEGDCDSDVQCKGNLVCGIDNCPWGDRDDCCEEPSYLDLDAASHYFNLPPQRLDEVGEFKYMCTRNNEFSNRSQKGRIRVKSKEEAKEEEAKEEEAKEEEEAKDAPIKDQGTMEASLEDILSEVTAIEDELKTIIE